MEELSMRMRFKRNAKVIVIFVTILLCAWDVISFLGSGLDIARHGTQRLKRGMMYRPFGSSIDKRPIQARLKDICRGIPPDKYSDWTRNPDHMVAPTNNLSYCIMHNEMDDIWARMFEIFINASKIGDYSKPRFPQIHKTGLIEDLEASDIENSKTVLYVRNPYARLYVLYHDRFHLVTAHSQHEKWCENITFQEFLDKVITHVKLRQDWAMTWVAPLVPKCRLCDVNVFSVIREENFNQDMQEFTQKLFKLENDSVKRLETILKPAILLHSIVLAKLNFRSPTCKHMEDHYGSSLWRSLQYMGYVNNSVQYPESLDNANVALHPDILVKAVLKAGNMSSIDKEILTQRQTILADAYRYIKEETIEYIQDIYKYEFEMFGYSKTKPYV